MNKERFKLPQEYLSKGTKLVIQPFLVQLVHWQEDVYLTIPSSFLSRELIFSDKVWLFKLQVIVGEGEPGENNCWKHVLCSRVATEEEKETKIILKHFLRVSIFVTIVERYKIGFNTLFSFFLLSVYTFDQVDHKLPPSAWHVSSKSVCSLYRSCSNTLPLRVRIFTWDGGTERWWWWWKADSDWVFWAISDQRTHQQFVSRVCVYVKEPVWSRHDICKSPRPFVSDFQLRDKMSCSFLRRILFLPGYHHHTNVYQMLEHFLWHRN